MNPTMTFVSVCSRVGHTPGSHTTFDNVCELKFAAHVEAAAYSENSVRLARSPAEISG